MASTWQQLRVCNIVPTALSRSNFKAAHDIAPHFFEPVYNMALLLYRSGDFSESFK